MNYVLVYDLLRGFGMFFGGVALVALIVLSVWDFRGCEPSNDGSVLNTIAEGRLGLVCLVAIVMWLTCRVIRASMRKVMTDDEIARGEEDASE